MRRTVLGLLRCTSGNAVIECAIVLPLALSLMAGAVDFGRGLQGYLTVEKALRSATRYLARVPAASVDGWALTRARNLALTGTLDGSGSYLLPNWQDANSIVLTHLPTSGAPKVSLTARVPFRLELLANVGFSAQVTLTLTHEERHVAE